MHSSRRVVLAAVLAAAVLLVGCTPSGAPATPTHSEEPTVPTTEPTETTEPGEFDLADFPGRIELPAQLTKVADGPEPFYVIRTSRGLVGVTLHTDAGFGGVLVIAAPEDFILPEDEAERFAALESLAELTGGSLQVVEIR